MVIDHINVAGAQMDETGDWDLDGARSHRRRHRQGPEPSGS
jgi:hypothetical protein